MLALEKSAEGKEKRKLKVNTYTFRKFLQDMMQIIFLCFKIQLNMNTEIE